MLSGFRLIAHRFLIMSRPLLKKQIAFPLAAVIFFAATAGVYYLFDPQTIREYLSSHWSGQVSNIEHEKHPILLIIELGLLLSVAFLLVRVLGHFIFWVFHKRKGYEAPSLVRDIFSIVCYTVAVAFILKQIFQNISFGALLPTSALLGVILGLALQDTLGNLFAGISLHADKPFQVGDVIVVGKNTGVVESITWRACKIRTFQNHIVLVSNAQIAREQIEVCPRDNLNARIVFFNALYTDSPAKVIHVVREAVREADNVSKARAPIVRIRNLGDSGVEYEVKYWLEDYSRYNDTDALIRQRIWYAYRRAGLGFAYPTQTLYLNRETKSDGVRAFDGRNVAERLSQIDIFAPLSSDELKSLAEDTDRHIYAPGEAIIRAGDAGDSMFVIHRGHVEVRVNNPSGNGRQRAIATLTEGDFFGEMALFTGEPRTASVVAIEETEVLEIGHQAIRRLFDANPDLVESLSLTIAERRAALKARKTAQSVQEESAGLLESIKRFFRLK
jgi:small-conductance mechanosensitive channel/CRP-like cAMP-binding protein